MKERIGAINMITPLYERYDYTAEPDDVQKLLGDLVLKGASITPLRRNVYKVEHNNTECLIDTSKYNVNKKVEYKVKSSSNKWVKMAFGVLAVSSLLWLLKFITSQVTNGIVPEDKEARKAYDQRRNKGLSGTMGSLISLYGSL